jgi:hypothetical protein
LQNPPSQNPPSPQASSLSQKIPQDRLGAYVPLKIPKIIVLPCSHDITHTGVRDKFHGTLSCDGTLSLPKNLTCRRLKDEKGFCGTIDVDWGEYNTFYNSMRSSRNALRKRCRNTTMLTEATIIYYKWNKKPIIYKN